MNTIDPRAPKVIMMRRLIEDYVPKRRAEITVVYRSYDNVSVRWFRNAKNLPDAEISDMISVAGTVYEKKMQLCQCQTPSSVYLVNTFGDMNYLLV